MKKICFLFVCILCIVMCSISCAENSVFAFEDPEYAVLVGKTLKLKPIAQNIEGKLTYSWSSSDENIATVNNGSVKGIAGGEVTITCTATTKAEETYSASCKVIVNIPIKSITASEKSIEIAPGPFGTSARFLDVDEVDGHYYLYKPTITIAPEDASVQTLEWSSSKPEVADVTEDGIIVGIRAGTATITGKAIDGSGKSVKIKVTVPKCYVTSDNVTIDDPSGVTIGYIFTSANGINSYGMKTKGDLVDFDYLDDVDEMTMLRLIPIKAGSGSISLTHNGRTAATIKIKVEHSAVYDDVSYPAISFSELLSNPEQYINSKTHFTCTIIKTEAKEINLPNSSNNEAKSKYCGLIYGVLEEEGERQYVIFEHDQALLFTPGESYTIYGIISKFVEYQGETGLNYTCPYLIYGHINS